MKRLGSIGVALLAAAQVMGQDAGVVPSLRSAAEEALRNNPGIRALRSRVAASETGLRQSRAEYFPQLNFEEIFTNGDDPVYVFGSLLRQGEFGPRNFDPALLNNPSPLNNFNHRLTLSQLLYDGGQRERRHSLAGLQLESRREELRGAEQRLLFELMGQYHRVQVADQALEVARESVHTAESVAQQAQQREAVGLAVKSDVMRLEVQLAEFRGGLLAAENDLLQARRGLELALGRQPAGLTRVSARLSERAAAPADADQLLAVALRERPDVRLAGLSVQMARDRTRSALGTRLPQVRLDGSYDFNHGTSTGLGNQYLVAVRLQFPLFDAGARRAGQEAAHREQEAAEQSREALENRARLEVQGAHDRQRLAWQQYQVSRQAADLSEEGLRIVRNRYEAGLATTTDLLSAQLARHQAQLAVLQALYRFHVELAALELAAGTLAPESAIMDAPP